MKSRSSIAGTLALCLLAAGPVAARDMSMAQLMRGGKTMRISASFQTSVPVTGSMALEDEAKATESARKSLYQIAARECSVITQVFKGACQMASINVSSYMQDRGNGMRQIAVSANASYVVVSESGGANGADEKKL